MIRPSAALIRSAIFLHRWMGVTLSLIFTMWFLSGIVMMYWGFPDISERERLEHLPVLNPDTVKVAPLEAFQALGNKEPPSRVTLSSFDGRPVYRFHYGRDEAMIYADDGSEQIEVPHDMVRRIALTWANAATHGGDPYGSNPREEEITGPDQWTVQASLDDLRPLWKYSFPDGFEVYVSSVTGEVVQASTTSARIWAYLGPIPHWLYFTPLRIHGQQWSNLVIWLSGIGTVTSLLGILVGIWMYSPRKTYFNAGQASSIPYTGQKRWHTVFGLFFGLMVCTWAFSGMLSMDPFPMNAPSNADNATGLARVSNALREDRAEIAIFSGKHPREALRSAGNYGVKELELTTIAGEPMYVAASTDRDGLFIPVNGSPFREFDAQRIAETMRRAASPAQLDIRELTEYDAYYLDRHREKPLPVLLVTEKGSDAARYYVDPKTARIVGSYNSGQWMSRWLYHGLHSWNFPWLYNNRPLWDIVVIALMLGGSSLCVTSIILAWHVLQRKVVGRA